MNMRSATLHTLADSGAASFIDLIGATCEGADDFNVNLLPGILHQLIKEGRVIVDCGLYSAKK
jgi:hypothetical protein